MKGYTRHARNIFLALVLTAASLLAQESARPVPAAFLDETAARAAIVDDSLAPYFIQFQPMEMSAKTGSPIPKGSIEQQRAETRKRYQAGVRAFTTAETDVIRRTLNRIQPVLAKEYPLVAATPWRFMKLSDSIEGGLPHTRGRHIVLSERILHAIVQNAALPPERMADLFVIDVLVHEQIHVVQRLHPGLFQKPGRGNRLQ